MNEAIVVEQRYSVSAQELWDALTDASRMKRWFFSEIESFEAVKGFETEFTVHVEQTDYVHLWTVLDCEARRCLVLDWRYRGIPGASVVRFELFEADQGVGLRVIHTDSHTFPQDNPVFQREAGVGGWTYFLQDSLKKYLDPSE